MMKLTLTPRKRDHTGRWWLLLFLMKLTCIMSIMAPVCVPLKWDPCRLTFMLLPVYELDHFVSQVPQVD